MPLGQELILNRYRPMREAGAGGFGTVQVAWDTLIQRRVAIKCLQLPEWGQGEAVLPAKVPGLDEARMAALLQDSSIVAVHDFQVQGSTAYLIMEYVEGFTLAQLLHDFDDRWTLDMTAAVFSDVSHALEMAHGNQVLHLDIKPDNILVNHQGQVKVTDFGLSTLVDVQGTGQAGGGTIGYMPLEQMRQEPLDVRCDEWALASVTYEMLTGENPFFAPDLPRAQAAIEDAELVLPSLCWDELDPKADDVLFYALDPDCEERYDSVAEFAEELEEYLGDPKRGHRQLAELVALAEGGEEPEEEQAEPSPRPSLAERFGPRQRVIAAHALGCAGSAALTWASLACIPQASSWDGLAFWGLVALVALAGALRPYLGCLLALGVLAVALLLNQVYALGAALAVALAVFSFCRASGKRWLTVLGAVLALAALAVGAYLQQFAHLS